MASNVEHQSLPLSSFPVMQKLHTYLPPLRHKHYETTFPKDYSKLVIFHSHHSYHPLPPIYCLTNPRKNLKKERMTLHLSSTSTKLSFGTEAQHPQKSDTKTAPRLTATYFQIPLNKLMAENEIFTIISVELLSKLK